jgi:hypothetical protein
LIVVGFGIEERRYISEWFHDSGLAKRDQLPPGLQRQLQKDEKLPPGLEQKFEPLPTPLELRLPELPTGTRRIVLGDNVILLDETTSFIVDIITGI